MRNLMSRVFLCRVLAMIVVIGTISVNMKSETLRLLGDDEMRTVRGGDQYCVGSAIDPVGPYCDTCTSNGNNQYVKCDNLLPDMMLQFARGQSPAQRWDTAEVTCTYGAKRYSDSSCTNQLHPSMGNCYRTYTTTTFLGYANGVYCGGS